MVKRAQSRRRSGTEDANEASFDSPFNPVEILMDWRDATILSARALTGAPLRLCGIETAKLKKGELSNAVRGFPIVGLGAGLIAGLSYAIADGLGLPALISSLLAVATLAFLTGGVFEGELARLADTLIGGGTKTQQLARLKDRALGNYAMIVLFISLGLRVGALAAIDNAGAVTAALAAALSVSYAALAIVLYVLPPARRSGFAYLAGRPGKYQAILAALLGGAIAFLFLGPATAVVALAIGALGAFKFAYFAKRNLGGTTRAVLGGCQQGAEIGVLLAVVALA